MATTSKRSWITGKGVARVAWSVTFVDGAGRRKRRQFNTKREAEDFRVQVETELRSGLHRPDANRVTVADLCSLYLEHCRGRVERGERFTRRHFATVDGHVRNHILNSEHGIASIVLSKLTPGQVNAFRDHIRFAGITVPTARKVISTLRNVLQHAVDNDLVATNSASKITVIGKRGDGPKIVVPPSKASLRRILEVADENFRAIVIFAASTGLRAGELWSIRWEHIDLKNGTMSVLGRVDAYGQLDTTKTVAGVRDIPLAQPVATELKRWRLRSPFNGSADLVFPNREGRYMSHDNLIKRRWKPTLERADVDPINWHSLRHYAISTWIEVGLQPKTVQTFAGHSSLQVTMDRYGHLFPSDDRSAAIDVIARDMLTPRR